jgi:glycosyltransferase involved in cell wall biosynthesis
MNIAVNTRQLRVDDTEGKADLILNCFSILAEKYPQHRFIYIFDQAFDQKFITSENIIPVVAGREARTSLRLQYWFNYKVPAVLKKYKADVFVSMDGICSLRTRVPQCLFIHDLSFIQSPQFWAKSKSRFYKKFTSKFLAKANIIAAISESMKADIIKQYDIAPEKVSLVYKSAAPIFRPIGEKEKENIKAKYTDGKEYFLYAGPVDPGKNLLNLLKAFSFFKKRQKSSMQLLIAGKAIFGYSQFTNDLATFKFRDEVKWLDDLSESQYAEVMAAAHTVVYPVFVEGRNAIVMEAMQCGVPVVISNAVKLPESLTDAVLYADPGNFLDIADKMMLLFKDEDKRSQLIKVGKTVVQEISPAKTADMLWDCIAASIKKETA